MQSLHRSRVVTGTATGRACRATPPRRSLVAARAEVRQFKLLLWLPLLSLWSECATVHSFLWGSKAQTPAWPQPHSQLGCRGCKGNLNDRTPHAPA